MVYERPDGGMAVPAMNDITIVIELAMKEQASDWLNTRLPAKTIHSPTEITAGE